MVALSNHTATEHGVRLSGPAGAPAALPEAMTRLADGRLRLRNHTVLPLADSRRRTRASRRASSPR